MVTRSQKFKLIAPRPFRLVKFISFTGLGLILITTLVLSWVISNYAKRVMLDRSESYSLLLAEHVNRQVFLQFVLQPHCDTVKLPSEIHLNSNGSTLLFTTLPKV